MLLKMSVQQNLPDTYSVPVTIHAQKRNTNPRYKHFTQNHFTAGDEEQFYANMINKTPKVLVSHSESSETEKSIIWDKFEISPESIQNTFSYLFFKFKKGIFIQIRNGKVVRFLPFSNTYYVNEWSDLVTVPEELRNDPKVLPVRYWYANNGLVRFESPCNETDTGMCQMKHMFEKLCTEFPKEIPDIDFFVNRRDFPLMKTDGTEPYENMFNSENEPLRSHNYHTYAPILSMCTAEKFADIPIPTMDDWTRVMFPENIHFAMTRRTIATRDIFDIPWNKKSPMFMFRGSNTGIGVNSSTNPRLKLCEQFKNNPCFNVGITNPNMRHRKVMGVSGLQIPKVSELIISSPKTLIEQSSYKFIIHIQGHTQAFRLSIELAMNSVLLIVKGKYRLWYESKLIPWKHFVPVESDLSDLLEKVSWCLENDRECEQIAKNARQFYDTYLSKKGCLTYLKNLLCEISHKCLRENYPLYTLRPNPITLQRNYLRLYPFQEQTSAKSIRNRTYSELINLYSRIDTRCHRKKVIFRNSKSEIILMKNEYISKRSNNIEHEKFVGLYCVNNILKHIPNFVFTIPYNMPNTIFLEYVEGETLFDYIRSNHFKLNEWVFFMIQILLSISVAQRVCFFTHNDLNSWNIILKKYTTEQVFDYLVDVNNIYRVYTTTVPVILDFDKSHVVFELQSFSQQLGFNPYHDTLCLLINSLYNIFKYQQLSSTEERSLLFLFKRTICDPLYCPEYSIKTISDMKLFLEQAHKYSHLSFSNKGNLYSRTPNSVITLLKNMFKPCYMSGVKILNNMNLVTSVENRNIGTPKRTPTIPKNVHPFLQLYLKQLFFTDTQDGDEINREAFKLDKISIPILSETNKIGIYDFPSKYLDYINIFIEILCSGGPYQLLKDEKNSLTNALKPYLDIREKIYIYSKYHVNFKLQRNIL